MSCAGGSRSAAVSLVVAVPWIQHIPHPSKDILRPAVDTVPAEKLSANQEVALQGSWSNCSLDFKDDAALMADSSLQMDEGMLRQIGYSKERIDLVSRWTRLNLPKVP